MGGTGHVGSATSEALLSRSEPVTIITRCPERAAGWRARGANIVAADVNDVGSLRAAFRFGRRALLLNPPADPSGDTDAVERRTVANILAALSGSELQKVVAASTGGAQPGHRLGDFGTLWELEEGLRQQSMPAAINRAAYYMSNWDGLLDTAQATGKLPTFYPADLPIPMVAPCDVGQAAAARLISGVEDVGVLYVEGPARYSSADVAKAFSDALSRPVHAETIPRERWKDTFLQLGFSDSAADSYARMAAVTIDHGFDMANDALRGATTLSAYVANLVAPLHHTR
jgi:uncharacterized protein YbjT (DUF2867 family)